MNEWVAYLLKKKKYLTPLLLLLFHQCIQYHQLPSACDVLAINGNVSIAAVFLFTKFYILRKHGLSVIVYV